MLSHFLAWSVASDTVRTHSNTGWRPHRVYRVTIPQIPVSIDWASQLLRQDFGSWHTGSRRILGSRWLGMGCQQSEQRPQFHSVKSWLVSTAQLSIIDTYLKLLMFRYNHEYKGPSINDLGEWEAFLNLFFPRRAHDFFPLPPPQIINDRPLS